MPDRTPTPPAASDASRMGGAVSKVEALNALRSMFFAAQDGKADAGLFNIAWDFIASLPDAAPAGEAQEPVAWQWRKRGQPWSLDRTFNSQVFATTADSEVRALYAAAPAVPAARMLTPEEVRSVYVTNEQRDEAAAFIRLFCEVNGIPLDGAKESGNAG